MKTVVCKANWFDLRFYRGKVAEQFVENATPRFARRLRLRRGRLGCSRLGCRRLRGWLLLLVLEQRMPRLDRVTMPRFRGRMQEVIGTRAHRLGDTVVGL